MNFEIVVDGIPMLEFEIDTQDLTFEQYERLTHHVRAVSPQVFEASVRGMLKGVQKYGPEPEYRIELMDKIDPDPAIHVESVMGYWLPHIFSEGVDAANQTGLLADTLGVDVLCQPPT